LPIEALETENENLPLSKSFLGSNDYFALKVEGDSMIEAGINTGDYVIIKKTNAAENGKIVVALIDNHEATLKRMRRKGHSIALESANPAYETKIYNPERVKIQGVLASLYRKF
jgi:repressor LexA